ncbi:MULTISPECIES: hypothetical protein [unclassified Synechococcus]|uniref:hypothetical protein n=1 Tax=unclassified Synechococcus TaxID=2626047 RepID=UPI0000699638|nr:MULTISPECIES: hypothetical protein [unclassified Synechococcus]EAQ75282.1 3-octaprenyl-4-hydroxybenzoate carboxy-lyase [Synechococcus sp. WH 5701]MCP9825063.1 hypothetical protein [Synechococcus sp. EJ6-Ellesmere]WFN57864.1 hypothetical protein N4320_08345 [Synechococcus sp. CCFWC 502]CAK6691579.1 hypothetical protein ICNINCKA_01039 [Synechococcus sp. CBW1107]
MLQRLLLLPLLAPLLAVLLVAALNPTPASRLRLLIWTSPALPIGVWLALAASGGAALSAGLTALALQQPGDQPLRRRSVQPSGGGDRREPEPWDDRPQASARPAPQQPPGGYAGPERAPQEPPPTLSVPFRILRTGSGGAPASATATASPGNGDAEGWDTPPSDDW